MKVLYSIWLGLFMFGLLLTPVEGQELVANYSFSGNAEDATSFDNHGVVRGAQLATDRFGFANKAFSFDGKQSAILADNEDQLLTDATTVSFWVNVNNLPGQGEAFLLSFGGWQERFKISLPPHGKVVWTTNSTSGISDMDAGDGNELVPGEWTHLAFVHDGVEDRVYVNGALANSKAVTGTLNSTTHPLGIGFNPIDNANYFDGSMDEVQIYDGALSEAQIADLYTAQNTAPVVTEGRVAAYEFNGNLRDETVHGNHGKGTDLKSVADNFGFGDRAFYFNGESSKVDIDNSTQLNSDAVSVSFWINVFELPDQGEVYVASHGGWQERWKISLPSHGKLVWTTNHENGISDLDAGDANALAEGEWAHVIMVHDGTKDKIYVNGQLAAEKDVVGAMNATNYDMGIGYDPIDGGNYFNGTIDGVWVFNTGMTDQGVADLYAQLSTNPAEPGILVADYQVAGSADDYSQFENDGEVSGASFIKDRFGYGSSAYQFDGVDDYIWASNSEALNSDYTTVSFWVNVTNLPGNGEAFMVSNGGWQERLKISVPTHGKVVFTTNSSSGISDMDAGDGNELVPGVWTHVVMVHDTLQDKIFIDGVLANAKDVGGIMNSTKYPLGLGYNTIDGGNFFDGSLDNVQFYNVPLSDDEVAALYAEQSAEPNFVEELVADYTFNGNARDNTVFMNHAWVDGAQLTSDRFDQANHAYNFDGVNDEVTAENSKQLNSPQTTVSFWINVNELPGNGEAFILSFGGWQERWKISLPTHGKPVWTTNHENGISDMDSGDGNELVPGTWTHVVMTHDGVQDKIYFDGLEVASKDVAGDLNETNHPLGMGFNPIDGGNFLNGSLDEVQIYNVALTAQEIADLYAEQSTPPVQVDFEAPSAPLDLNAEVNFTDVDLSWTASTDNFGVTAYNVYLDSVKVQTVAETSTSFTGLAQLTEYEFGVSAVDAAGNESLTSYLLVTTGVDEEPDTEAPTAPGNLMANAGSNSVVLSWTASTDNQALAGYVVLVDGVIFDTLSADKVSVFIGGLESETPYTFEIYAFDLAGNNSEISDITVTTEPPIDTGEEGLVAWYPFENNANDATPYENHGNIGGDPVFEAVTARPNASGTSIVFDGEQDSVLVPNAVQLISDYTTVGFWIRVDGQNFEDAEAYVLDFGHWSERWKISLPQHLKIVWTTNSENNMFPNAISDMDSGDGNELVLGFWWYVTMVHDGVDDIVYLDGVEVNRKAAAGTLNSTALPFGMGNNPIDGGQYFIGSLDEVKIYNKALTGEEIEKLYETGTTGVPFINPELSGYIDLLYPNPTIDQLTIRHAFKGNQDLLIRIFDEAGRQVDAYRYDRSEVDLGRMTIPVNRFNSGTYAINFVYGGKNLGSVPFIKL